MVTETESAEEDFGRFGSGSYAEVFTASEAPGNAEAWGRRRRNFDPFRPTRANRHDREDERCGDSANDSLPLFGWQRVIAGRLPNTENDLVLWIFTRKGVEPGTVRPNLGVPRTKPVGPPHLESPGDRKASVPYPAV